jgi:hypothetical protein
VPVVPTDDLRSKTHRCYRFGWGRSGLLLTSLLARWLCAGALVVACSSSKGKPPPPPPATGKLFVAVTLDWEGAYFSGDALDALDALRVKLGDDVPVTHFMCAAYFSKPEPDPEGFENLRTSLRPGDELALHLHLWKSLAIAASIEPKLSPSFLTGTDKLVEFPDGDIGFDTDLDVYGVADLRALVRTSKKLLEPSAMTVSTSFRAGGYLATPKVLQAIRDEGFTTDSSAAAADQFNGPTDKILRQRIKEVWPAAGPGTQPYVISTPSGPIVEMPISAVADYVSAGDITDVITSAHERLAKDRTKNVFVVLAFHQETADEFGARIHEALQRIRARPEIAADLTFTTIANAAELVRGPPKDTPGRSAAGK